MNTRFNQEVEITAGEVTIKGQLTIPLKASAIIIFSHGSGSSRFSKRNQDVAGYLNERNFGTLLFDLLTEQEDRQYQNRFNIDLLSKRLNRVSEWLKNFIPARGCRIGYFGASTGAASALQAAAHMPEIGAVVSRGGRPDLAKDYLKQVMAPTLFIVGGLDNEVTALNKEAFNNLNCTKELVIVPGASHLFEEEGKLEKVAALTAAWFEKYLQPVEVQ